MLVAVCQIEIFLPESTSLKSKRSVLTSLKKNIRNKFNVSVAEVAHQDKWQRATLGVSMITNESRFIDKTMASILNLIDNDGRVEILEHMVELY